MKRINRADRVDAGPQVRPSAGSIISGETGIESVIEHAEPPGPAPELPLGEKLPEARAGKTAIAILDAVQQTASAHGYFAAGEEAARRLRAARELRSPERRFVSDALAEILRGLRRLRTVADRKHLGGRALYLTYLLTSVVDQAQASAQPVEALPKVLGHRAAELGLAAAEILQRARTIDARAHLAALRELPVAEQVTAIGEALSYPDWLVAALLEDLGLPSALAVLRAQNQRAPLTVRANLLRCSRAELRERLRSEGVTAAESALAPQALRLLTRANVYALPSFTQGLFELQDEGSQLIAELCAPPPGGIILDACAGAGGKTLALGALLGNKGRIIALDVDRRRLSELQKRARRAGLSCVQALCVSADGQPRDRGAIPGELPPGVLMRGAHRVLCDVPCSGLGVLRRHPEARWHLGPQALAQINLQQRQILAASARHVQPHGRLIYATCTLLRRENDDVVDEFLSSHPDFTEVPIKELLGTTRAQSLGDGQRLRLLPTEGGPDGFFAAVLRRRD